MKHPYLAKLLFLLLLAVIGFPSGAYAQNGSVSGRITDSKNQGIPGATAVIEGTSLGSSSNVDGTFSIQNVPAGTQTLIISFIGYNSVRRPVTVVVGQNTEATASLTENITQLSEAVVVGYGTQRRQDVTGSITTVTSKDFVKGQITNPEQLVQGKVAGVQITSGGGAPGSATTIRIRGGSSLNASNDPLIVIDGVPVDGGSGIAGQANPLSLINPNDIESFNVLKDASATAIYGSRASNGVILITTKKGVAGEKLTVTVGSQFSVSKRVNSVDVLSADEFRAAVAQVDPSKKALLGTANTDWQKEIFRTAKTYENNVSLTGSVGKLPFRASYGNLNQEGILITSKLVRNTGSLSLNPTFFDNHLRVDLNLKGSVADNNFADNGAVGAAVTFNPTLPVRSGNDGLFGGYTEYLQNNGTPQANVPLNPVASLNLTRDRSTVKRSIGNIALDYKFHFLPELRANLNLGYDVSRSNGTKFVSAQSAGSYNRTALDPANTTSRAGENNFYSQYRDNKLLEFYLNYTKQFGDSRVEVLGGYSYQDFITGSPNNENYLADGSLYAKAAPFPFKTQYTLLSFYGRANYNYKDRYLATVTVRNDGTSRFPNNKYGTFPAASLAWRIKGEDFLKDNVTISELKLRVGAGQTGQQDIFGGKNDYPAIQRFVLNTPTAQYPFGDGAIAPYSPKGYNQDLKWETTTTYNAGLDYGFLNGRIGGAVDVYYRKTTDLLAEIFVPALTNPATRLFRNIGTLENRGLELSINAVPVRSTNVNWDVNFNATFNENKITSLGQQDPNFQGYPTNGVAGGTGTNIGLNSVGYSSSSYYVRKQVYGQDGKPINDLYADLNGNGGIDGTDLYHYKQFAPKAILGFSSNVAYKQLNLAFTLRSNIGNYAYNNVDSQLGTYGGINNSAVLLSNVTRDATYTNFDRVNSADHYLSDYYIQNASFLRMENVTLGYNVAKLLGDKANLRLTFAVQNVFVVTKYKGLDPEIANGIDNNIYPRPRAYTVGLNFSL